VNWLVDKK